jgi:hypothetical protein
MGNGIRQSLTLKRFLQQDGSERPEGTTQIRVGVSRHENSRRPVSLAANLPKQTPFNRSGTAAIGACGFDLNPS